MVETVLAMPVLLVLITGAIQFSHIWMARHIVHYASFCAARAALVSQESEGRLAAEDAADLACAWIVKGHRAGELDKEIPGWGGIPGSGAYVRKTRVESLTDAANENVEAKVGHDFGMVVFLAGPIIGWLVNPWEYGHEWELGRDTDLTGNAGQGDLLFHPHIPLTEQVSLPKPYKVMTPTAW